MIDNTCRDEVSAKLSDEGTVSRNRGFLLRRRVDLGAGRYDLRVVLQCLVNVRICVGNYWRNLDKVEPTQIVEVCRSQFGMMALSLET